MRAMADRQDRPHRGADPHPVRSAGHADHDPVGEDAADPGAERARCRRAKGFNVIATANNRDQGVNELSCALKRRFNTVVLPVPARRGGGRDRRAARRRRSAGRWSCRPRPAALEEIRRVVTDLPRASRRRRPPTARPSSSRPAGTLSHRPRRSRWSPAAWPWPRTSATACCAPATSPPGIARRRGQGPGRRTAWSGRSTWRRWRAERDGWKDLYRGLP